ncbi:hypothetical protein [Devosia nitrariae]|uniref:Uncharacterized protein n=1 Tax=Devosia nitrariae TaxID=2071872 RepID=A0ABQ5WDT5_9HYPH|nr:hypothetical protein [Devosia nitrariae]GLQ58053.1 hypothetical protein GCM10010862_53120 [Devosia nitrariae]
MYIRRSNRRRVLRAGYLLLALVLLTPKFDLSAAPQLTAFLNTVGLGQTLVDSGAPLSTGLAQDA